jgi:hypothetical protein
MPTPVSRTRCTPHPLFRRSARCERLRPVLAALVSNSRHLFRRAASAYSQMSCGSRVRDFFTALVHQRAGLRAFHDAAYGDRRSG